MTTGSDASSGSDASLDVTSIVVDEEAGVMDVAVAEDNLAQAIGRVFGRLGDEVTAEIAINDAQPSYRAEVTEALARALGDVRIGNPASKEVGMGALASHGQRNEVRERVGDLSAEA